MSETADVTLSWKAEILAFGETEWCSNALRFATAEEAEASGQELSMRWMLVKDWRATPSNDPVNYKFENGKNVRLNEN
jgi:hypothetical protein